MAARRDTALLLTNIFAEGSLPLGGMYDDHSVLPYGNFLPSLQQRQHFDKHIANFLEKFLRLKFRTEQNENQSVEVSHTFLDDVEPQEIPPFMPASNKDRLDEIRPLHIANRPPLSFPHPLVAFAHINVKDPRRYRVMVDYNSLHYLYKVLEYRGPICVVWLGKRMWDLQLKDEYSSWLWKKDEENAETYSPLHPGLGPQGELLSDIFVHTSNLNPNRSRRNFQSIRQCPRCLSQHHLRRQNDPQPQRYRFPRVPSGSSAIRGHRHARDGQGTSATSRGLPHRLHPSSSYFRR